MKSKIIFIIFLFTIISTKIIIDGPELIPICINNLKFYETSNKYKKYVSNLNFDNTIHLTYDINKAKKYCDDDECMMQFDFLHFLESFSIHKNTFNLEKQVNGTYFSLYFQRINEKNSFCIFKTKINGKFIQQYDITKKLVCNRMNENKCKIIYGKRARKLLESEKNFVAYSIYRIIDKNIKNTLDNYIK